MTPHGINPAGHLGRGQEPKPSVTLHRHMVYGSGLTHPLDYVTLAHLLFMVSEGRSFTVADVVTALREQGIRSGNGSSLIGKDAVYDAFKRLISGGFVRRLDQAKGRSFGAVEYELYEQPGYNVDWQPSSDPYRFDGDSALRALPEAVPAGNDKVPGRSASGIGGYADAGCADARSAKRRVSAGRSASGIAGSADRFPPHPPEEVETSSPYPLKQSAVPTEEEADFSPEQIAEAERFLQMLPAPWTVGRKTAQRLAPLLLEAAAAQGWQLDDDLRAQLTSNPDGIKRHASVLEKERIADLPLRAALASRLTAVPAAQPAAVLPAWCEDLDCDEDTRERTITDAQGYRRTGPCPDCHPANSTRQEAA